jgi:hypothetical protein
MKTTTKNYKLTETGKAEVLSINTCTICGKDIMKLIGIIFTRLGGIYLAYLYFFLSPYILVLQRFVALIAFTLRKFLLTKNPHWISCPYNIG